MSAGFAFDDSLDAGVNNFFPFLPRAC